MSCLSDDAKEAPAFTAERALFVITEQFCYQIFMQIYLFASDSHPGVSAFTSDEAGDNLPADYAPWRPVNSGRAIPLGSPGDRIAVTIQRDGYFLLAAIGHVRAKRETN